MKKITSQLLVVILLIGCMLVSCDNYAGYWKTPNNISKYAYVVACSQIPGVLGCQFAEAELIEQDAYGRKMYKFSCLTLNGSFYGAEGSFYYDSYNTQTKTDIHAYVISQKETKYNVYYLDTVSYVMRLSWDEFDTTILENFKALNDWGKEEFSIELCSLLLPISWGKDANVVEPYFFEVKDAYIQYTKKTSDFDQSKIDVSYVCNDKQSRCLAFVRERDFSSVENKSYVVIVSRVEDKKPYYILELKDFYDNNEDVAKIKKMAGWEVN